MACPGQAVYSQNRDGYGVQGCGRGVLHTDAETSEENKFSGPLDLINLSIN